MVRINAHRGTAALRYAAVGLTVTLALGGCSGPDAGPDAEAAQGGTTASPTPPGDAATSSSETASATATASSTAAAYKPATEQGPAENVPLPVMPELAKEESKEGLEAFAEHWYALVNYGFETGNATPLTEISGPNCTVCGNVYRMMDSGFAGDDWMLGGRLHVVGRHSSYEITSKSQFQVLVQLSQDDYEFRGPGGTLYGTHEGFDATTVQMIEATYKDGWFAHDVVTIQ